MLSYIIATYCHHRLKTVLVISSLTLYFVLIAGFLSLNQIVDQVSLLPFKKIGANTIVQKNGKIPNQMTEAVFPHANGPIDLLAAQKLSSLPFVQEADAGIYFWYFDDQYFKSVFGIDPDGTIFAPLIKTNIIDGKFDLADKQVIITQNFAKKHQLQLNSPIQIGKTVFWVKAIIQPNISQNLIPADVYMNLDQAQLIINQSARIQALYQLNQNNVVNVVTLKTDPTWNEDKTNLISKLDPNYIVFSEKTFTPQINQQLKLVSSLGKLMLVSLSLIMLLVFALVTVYYFKSQTAEIALLRIIGWSLHDLKKHFLLANTILLIVTLVFGNLGTILLLKLLQKLTINLVIPWEVSARPHFLATENAIDRMITVHLPVKFDPLVQLGLSFCFLVGFNLIYLLLFRYIKNIKPATYLK